ncbi:NADH dehydrogenase [ubiquinone] 1 beta subcomplex subunit 10-like [Ornithodoros turicata]
MPEDRPHKNIVESFAEAAFNMVDRPVTWFRETIVAPNRPKYYWYHEKLRRVPEIDECYTDDLMCKFEADQQFKRDRDVESSILRILRRRRDDCYLYEAPDHDRCIPMENDYEEAKLNWFIKYGDIGPQGNVVKAFMKQKHRLVYERRQKEKEEANGF